MMKRAQCDVAAMAVGDDELAGQRVFGVLSRKIFGEKLGRPVPLEDRIRAGPKQRLDPVRNVGNSGGKGRQKRAPILEPEWRPAFAPAPREKPTAPRSMDERDEKLGATEFVHWWPRLELAISIPSGILYRRRPRTQRIVCPPRWQSGRAASPLLGTHWPASCRNDAGRPLPAGGAR